MFLEEYVHFKEAGSCMHGKTTTIGKDSFWVILIGIGCEQHEQIGAQCKENEGRNQRHLHRHCLFEI